MPRKHLTDSVIDELEHPEKGQILYWDDKQPGFGLRVTKTGKVFIVQGRVNGEDRREKIGKRSDLTTQEARVLAKSKLGDMAKGIDNNAEKAAQRAKGITLQQVFDDYRSSRALRDKTKKLYEDAMERFFSDWKNKRMVDITREMARERYSAIMKNVAAASEKRRKKTGGTAHRGKAQASLAMRFLSSLFGYAQERYEDAQGKAVVTENPVKALKNEDKGWRTVPGRQTVILPGELRNFYKGVQELQSDTARDYLMLLMLTGLRRREAAALTWDEVDLNDKSITLPGERTKNHKAHGLPLSDFLWDMFKRRKDATTGAYVFPSRKPGEFYDEPSASIRTVRKHIGKSFGCHDCRRSFTTVAEMLEIPPYTLQTLLNHSKADITNKYVVSNIERLRGPMQKITDFMLEKMEAPRPEPEAVTNVVLIDRGTGKKIRKRKPAPNGEM